MATRHCLSSRGLCGCSLCTALVIKKLLRRGQDGSAQKMDAGIDSSTVLPGGETDYTMALPVQSCSRVAQIAGCHCEP